MIISPELGYEIITRLYTTHVVIIINIKLSKEKN